MAFCELFTSRSRISNNLLKDFLYLDDSIHETGLFRSKTLIGLSKLIIQEFPEGVTIFDMACSYGHEPYCIALIIADQLGGLKQAVKNYPIFASDRSKEVIDVAKYKILWIDNRNLGALNLFKAYYHITNPVKVDDNTIEFQISEELFNAVSFRENNIDNEIRNINSNLPVVVIARNVWYYLDENTKYDLIPTLGNHLPSGSVLAMSNGDSQWCFYGRYTMGNYLTYGGLYDDISVKLEERDPFWEKTVFRRK
ncbi:MAG: hypothetical protein HY094_07010 [Candidatus Melainabacteria bacterium]|nr:hypothetical protein [Candidatus Melainabacteria bacterium]